VEGITCNWDIEVTDEWESKEKRGPERDGGWEPCLFSWIKCMWSFPAWLWRIAK